MFGMSQQQQVALIQQMAQLQLMNGMQKTPNNLAGGKLQKMNLGPAIFLKKPVCQRLDSKVYQVTD